jgi:hypothetical protein
MIAFLRKIARPWAVVFILANLLNIVVPTVSWALTSGPTAPEATSFEPVDTTDMVNLATGDFTYNIPLLEVPGPAGGYPLSLSYHAGIQPNEDASWVGLGWTLNPGAISRTVNGYPDDQLGAVRTRRDYDHGGERNTFSVGIGVPGVSFDLSISNDSNLGLGVGTSVSVGPSFKDKGTGIGIGADFTVGNDGYGNSYSGVSGGVSIGKAGEKARGLTANIGFSTNFNSVSLSSGVGLDFGANKSGRHNRTSLLGASISSSGLKPSLSVAGYNLNQTNSSAGRLTTQSWGISTPPIPIGPFTLTLGYNYLRYYSDETSDVNLIGTLNASSTGGKNPDDWSFDSYALLDPDKSGGIVENYDPDKLTGGSFPAYDAYNVSAQGLGGSIQPYIFDNGTLFRQNLKRQDGGYIIKFNGTSVDNPNSYGFYRPVGFRFKNDFSNSYSYESSTMRVTSDGSLTFNTPNTPTPPDGINSTTSQLAGSKHIEYFTNQQIKDGVAKSKGFIDDKPNAARETNKYGYNVSNQVGGLMITNESGVTYHYALPVYAYDQYSKSFKTGKENDVFQENRELHLYAYTWFLTAVTGPDYVSRNSANDGTISKNDWGYWVKFSYLGQSSTYTWRNPVESTHRDIDRETENYSYGKKELFYLDRIETVSHVAVFDKSERVDGRSVTSGVAGGFSPQPLTECRRDPNSSANVPPLICTTTTKNSVKTLKLNNIFLLSRPDYETSGSNYLPKSIRVISFETDNSLAPGTLNSFSDADVNAKLGKLTLKSLKFKGKAGADLIPPLYFRYNENPAFNKDASDMWGHYKNDYVHTQNENFDRRVTINSSQNVDAWSLSSIFTSTGTEIRVLYESDIYEKVALVRQNYINIKNVVPAGQNRLKIEIFDEAILASLYSVDQTIELSLVGTYLVAKPARQQDCECNAHDLNQLEYVPAYMPVTFESKSAVIKEIDGATRFLIVEDEGLYSDLYRNRTIMREYPASPLFNCNRESVKCNFFNRSFPDYISGGVLFSPASPIFGGGVRVSKITLYNSMNSTRSTSYKYSGGITSYEPFGIPEPLINPDYLLLPTITPTGSKRVLKKMILDRYSNLIGINREIPAPGVLYQTVTVEEEIFNEGETVPVKILGKKIFEFQVFDEAFVDRIGITSGSTPYTYRCFAEDGEPLGSRNCISERNEPPHHCKDQFGNPISCGILPAEIHTPLTLKDYSAWVGSLKKVTTYGANDQILNEVTTHYLHDDKTADQFAADLKTKFRNQGVISQLFNENRVVDNVAKPLISRRDEYPLVSIGQTSKDFKSGITNTTENLAFDFYTGNPTKVLSTDGYGNTYIAEIMPAYSIPEYSGMTSEQVTNSMIGMGLKVKNPKNRNMLTQEAANYTYKVNENYRSNQIDANKLSLVSASAQTWSDQLDVMGVAGNNQVGKQSGIWRKQSSFSFIGGDQNVPLAVNSDGLQPIASFEPFTKWSSTEAQAGWQKNAEITKYDYNSHAIEASDINDHYAATKFSYDHSQVLATAANAKYEELAYSGAEESWQNDQFYNASSFNFKAVGGGVYISGDAIPSTDTHSGATSVQANAGRKSFMYSFVPTKYIKPTDVNSYQVSVWSSENNAKIKYRLDNGGEQVATLIPAKKAGNWYQLNATIPVSGAFGKLEVWCEANGATTRFDDFRFHPYQAAMTSYVYNIWGELTHILDNNNLYTEYHYDGMGRLKETYKESFQTNYGEQGVVKVSEFDIHYSNKPERTVTVSISKTGGSGFVSSSGDVPVKFGTDMSIQFKETCSSLQLQNIFIDGNQIDRGLSSVTLKDGSQVLLTSESVTFKRLRMNHSITITFIQYNPDAGYRCNKVGDCPTGLIEYGIRNQCGEISWTVGPWRGLPQNRPNCCINVPVDCNCRIIEN